MSLRLVLLGGPGAGKGTQANLAAQRYNLPHVSTGDLLREHVEQGTALGKEAKQYLDEGKLVPDPLVWELFEERLSCADCRTGFILDGFPRTIPQAERLQEWLTACGHALDVAINLQTPDEEIVERITARRYCPECGAIFNMKTHPPEQDERCDRAGCTAPLQRREDDNEATVRERLRVYHTTTEPILAYYDQMGMLRTIACSGLTPEDIHERVRGAIARTKGEAAEAAYAAARRSL